MAFGMSNWTIQVPFSQPLPPPLAASSLIVCHLVLTPLMKYSRRKCSLPLKGKDEESHGRALRNVLERAREKGVKLKRQKCKIKIPEVDYIGDKISKDGIKPDESKIEAILNMPGPQNKKDVERLLGMVTYLSKFIPNMSALTEPLRALLRQEVQRHWGEQQESSLNEIKKVLTSSQS